MRRGILIFLLFSSFVVKESSALKLSADNVLSDELRSTMWRTEGAPSLPTSVISDGGDGYYWLADGRAVGKFDPINKVNVARWPIKPYSQHIFLSGEYLSYLDDIFVEGFVRPTNPMDIANRWLTGYGFYHENTRSERYGCMQRKPLRIGVLNKDEGLALFIGTKFIFFSLDLQDVVFSAHCWESDELSASDAEIAFPGKRVKGDPLHIAYSGTDVLVMKIYPAWRSLSKLYFGSFSDPESKDILLWRKLYESNLHGDDQKGFRMMGERLFHYSFRDGRYVLEGTESSTVKEWLDAKEMTWQSGFPTYSECPGEEGELIKILHDPMLNDPDVLH